jgi:hypothetical protein
MSPILSRLNPSKLWGLARFLYVQRVTGFDPPGRPLLDEESIEWLNRRLKSAKRYLEFGSGGSTVLANRLGVPSVSVESDRFYAAAVRQVLPSPEKALILTPSMGLTGPWGMPVLGRDRKGPRYIFAPFDQLTRGFPDLVFVDGRYRVACVLETARRAFEASATATLLLDDYTGRSAYHVVEDYLGKPELIGRAAAFVVGDRRITSDDVRPHLTNPG